MITAYRFDYPDGKFEKRIISRILNVSNHLSDIMHCNIISLNILDENGELEIMDLWGPYYIIVNRKKYKMDDPDMIKKINILIHNDEMNNILNNID